MLTRNLLRYSRRDGVLRPTFAAPPDPEAGERMEELLRIFRQSTGSRLGELREQLQPFFAGSSRPKLFQGFAHLLEKRLRLAEVDEPALREVRKKAFKASVAIIRDAPDPLPLEDFRKRLEATPGSNDLYADLPENRVIEGFDYLEAGELCGLYNRSLAAGLLSWATKTRVELASSPRTGALELLEALKGLGLGLDFHGLPGGGLAISLEAPAKEAPGRRKSAERAAAMVGLLAKAGPFSISATLRIPAVRARELEIPREDSGFLG